MTLEVVVETVTFPSFSRTTLSRSLQRREGAVQVASFDKDALGRRSHERDPCQLKAQIQADKLRMPCVIKDISSSGVKIKIDPACRLPKYFSLLIPVFDEINEARRCELRWRFEDVAGVKFLGAAEIDGVRAS